MRHRCSITAVTTAKQSPGAPFQQQEYRSGQNEQPNDRAAEEDPDVRLLDCKCERKADSYCHHQAGQAVEAGHLIEGDALPDEHQRDDHRYYWQEVNQHIHIHKVLAAEEESVSRDHAGEHARYARKVDKDGVDILPWRCAAASTRMYPADQPGDCGQCDKGGRQNDGVCVSQFCKIT